MPTSDIAFTAAVKTAQEERGSRKGYAGMESRGGWADVVTQPLRDFIAERDSLYFGTASADGQPYIQHRGGPRGFLKVLDDKTLAFADYSGNQQFISLGNLTENKKAYIFLMDYTRQTRIKLWGTAEFIEDDGKLLASVVDADYQANPQRVLRFHLEAWDVNCNQHITQRFTIDEPHPRVKELEQRVEQLEARLREAGVEEIEV